ncbi:hypothetical protein RGI145_19420 [Roseomonas gilardii]|uniref:Uncharacterized protein n=1 Tax=Roseomonas gilardii TaxID=257708 RepID=A0A1L7ALB6_9PROT|nr:hypothetical protein [Roseomonas gilardii]APT59519.1 hypothetical protein RGI145_19420 [Roseomonas gilardii]
MSFSDAKPSILDTVHDAVEQELRYLRSQGFPLKAGFDAVARKMGVTARRIRQIHERRITDDVISAREWLAAVELNTQRRRARIAAARALLEQEALHDVAP